MSPVDVIIATHVAAAAGSAVRIACPDHAVGTPPHSLMTMVDGTIRCCQGKCICGQEVAGGWTPDVRSGRVILVRNGSDQHKRALARRRAK